MQMDESKRKLSYNKLGFRRPALKTGFNCWRFFFVGKNMSTGNERSFFIEYEILNPGLAAAVPVLGFKTGAAVNPSDLQAALAGAETAAASAESVRPSYCVTRIGMMGPGARQLCSYSSPKSIKAGFRPFEISDGGIRFSTDSISGSIDITENDVLEHPECLCDSGSAAWNLKYEIAGGSSEGYRKRAAVWIPMGIRTEFSGSVSFNGGEYVVTPRTSFGYVSRYSSRTVTDPWFHLSSSHLTSIISGKQLFGSAFAVHGNFDGRLSLVSMVDGESIKFTADSSRRLYSAVWNCVQVPSASSDDVDRLHWSVSINSRHWIVDVDVFCSLKDLSARKLELPEGGQKVMSMVQSGTGTGEIKMFRRRGKNLEQIEYARVSKVFCEFGHSEAPEF